MWESASETRKEKRPSQRPEKGRGGHTDARDSKEFRVTHSISKASINHEYTVGLPVKNN